eukprot:TRINITY_DN6415_c0_g1_i2.p1 TRINITY_DN6415_c0_g1~~TRINITY_DN6415_c0_g1_i2.p1  ORF type:complete len:626 (+),score=111.18 TRINITY_DN6415_c0_g1_i2:317-2194(+)
MSAFGLIFLYLDELYLASSIIPIANYRVYNVRNNSQYMLIDATSLNNLDILQNSDTQGKEGTLLSVLDYCVTPFGKRLLQRWLCHPLKSVRMIKERLDAVDFLFTNQDILDFIKSSLSLLPDVERVSGLVKARKVKLLQFLSFLDNLDSIQVFVASLRDLVQEHGGAAQNMGLLNLLVYEFPDISVIFDTFNFDREEAKREGRIKPVPGSVPEYDEAAADLQNVEEQLADYLEEQKKITGIPDIVYHHSKTERYSLKVKKTSLGNRKIPKSWNEKANIKTESRYTTEEIENLVESLDTAQEALNVLCSNLLSAYLEKMVDYFETLDAVISHLCMIDVLASFATYAVQEGGPVCKPKFVRSEKPLLSVKEFRHPYITPQPGSSFIPNDFTVGGNSPEVWVISGPNMGGKSTLLRQSCILLVMAQIGSFVPAAECSLTPCDQIFTRLGASDKIFANQSTFMLELQETANILRNATPHSFVILDELGRGTSTFDGYAIAYAVLTKLRDLGCRTLFSTHYHKLNDEFQNDPLVSLGHMACEDSGSTITFLYQLKEGPCPKSYGMNVAQLANLPEGVVARAEEMGGKFETMLHSKLKGSTKNTQIFVDLMANECLKRTQLLQYWKNCQIN